MYFLIYKVSSNYLNMQNTNQQGDSENDYCHNIHHNLARKIKLKPAMIAQRKILNYSCEVKLHHTHCILCPIDYFWNVVTIVIKLLGLNSGARNVDIGTYSKYMTIWLLTLTIRKQYWHKLANQYHFGKDARFSSRLCGQAETFRYGHKELWMLIDKYKMLE